VQDPQVPGETQEGTQLPGMPMPEIRAAGFSYTREVSLALTGQTREWKEGFLPAWADMSPSAVEGQPKRLDWTPVRRVAVRPGYPQVLYAAIHNGYGLYRSTNGGGFWEQMPFGVGSGRTIVFANSSVAIATFGDWDGAKYANGGIWRTGDGGNTWQDVSGSIANTVVAVAFDPSNSNRIYAATYQAGIYRGNYSAGSVTWTQINSGLSDTWIYSIAVAPSSTNVLYAGGSTWVYRSDNSGDSWVIADNNYPSIYTEALAVDPGNANIFYAGAQRLGGLDPNGLTPGGFYKSTAGAGDGNLVLKNGGMQETFVLDIARDPLNANILYAGTWGSGFFKSTDGGDTWYEKNAGLELPYIYGIEAVADAGSPSGVTLYVATFYSGAGMFVSTDRGETWTDPWMSNFPSMFDITTTDQADNLAAATAYGVFISPDGGANWYISNDLTNQQNGIVLELARDPNNSSKLLAATYGGGIWTSTDSGANWSETSTGIGGGSYVYDVGFSTTAANTAYAGSYGVFRTTNGGATWAAFGSVPHYVRDVDGHNGITANLYAGTHDAGVFMSPNANGTWTNISSGLGDYRIRSVKAVAASQVFAGTNGDSAWKYTGSWTQKGPFIRAPGVIQIAIHPTNSAIIYAGTDQGVYKSFNGGESWVPKNQGLGGYGDLVISGISIDPGTPSTIYLGTWGYGIFKSTDSGDHWTRMSDPLKSTKVYLPLVLRNYTAPQPDYLFPTADTTILAALPNNNFGGAADMWVGYDFDPCSGGHTSRSLARFDTSGIPYGMHIFDAALYLKLVNSCDYDNRWHSTTVYRIPSSWSYSSVTWNTQPSWAEAYGTTSVGSLTWGWYDFDVTGLVQGWVNGSFSNYGLMIRGPESSSDGARLGFATLNWEGTASDPFIYVVWGSGDAPMGTAVLPAVGVPESDTLGPSIREMLPTFPSTHEEGPSGYVEQSAPED